MKELLYTKYKLDYAYFQLENGEKRKVDAFAFSLLESKLLQIENLKLPFNSKIDGTKAFYFDTESGLLKYVVWNYAIEADARGYVESRFREVEHVDFTNLNLSRELLEQLKKLLLFTYRTCSENTSAFLKFDIHALFENMSENAVLYAFLRLYYLFLPSEFANKVIFMNQYGDVTQNLGKFFSSPAHPVSILHFEQSGSYFLQLLHQSENALEYMILWKFIWKEFFQYEPKLSIENQENFIHKFQEIIRLWNKIQKLAQKSELSETELVCQHKLNDWIFCFIDYLLQNLYEEEIFSEQLHDYKKILHLLQKEKHAEIYQILQDKLYFHQMHNTTEKIAYLQEGFQILSDTETDYLPEDKAYYTRLCFAYIKCAETGLELDKMIRDIMLGNVGDFFQIISFEYLDTQELHVLYHKLAEHALQALQNYQGYCQDAEFQNLDKELKIVIQFAKHAGFDFQKVIFSEYAGTCRNCMQLQNFAGYFLNKNTSLNELLAFFSDWKLEDFYTKINLVIFDSLILALNDSNLSQAETKALTACLKQYKAFRGSYDNLLEQQEKLQELDADIENLCDENLDFILAYIDAYNACNSLQARQILLFVNKNILGNPAILLCIMRIYTRKFLGKAEQKKYSYYYQFYELLFLPLMKEDNLSMQDVKYIVWMFRKNEFLFKAQFKNVPLVQALEQRINKAFSEISLHTKEEKIKNFRALLLNRLCTRYQLEIQKNDALTREIETYHKKYMNFINTSELKKYGDAYISWLKKYMSHVIKEF